jgi:hypothetical protein
VLPALSATVISLFFRCYAAVFSLLFRCFSGVLNGNFVFFTRVSMIICTAPYGHETAKAVLQMDGIALAGA